ncbi:uncharacterized protein [Procambarus clarkii]|uniref:uncharacterized protein n=1 Tax=Procambarus clarkii TaxID=6728 RepID=UPI0037449C37
MSGAQDAALIEQTVRASIWGQISHDEDLFTQAHQMLIGAKDEIEGESLAKRDPCEVNISSTSDVRKDGESGDKWVRETAKSKRKRTSAAPKTLPPLLPMASREVRSPQPTSTTRVVTTESPRPSLRRTPSPCRRQDAIGASKRVSPPPLLPLSSTLFTMTPAYSTSPSASPPSKRSTPSSSPHSRRTPTPTLSARRTCPPPTAATPPSDSYSPTREEMEQEHRLKKRVCGACGDEARSLHFGGLACDSCKAFFRRAVVSNAFPGFVCTSGHNCTITVESRRSCQACRFTSCLRAGMELPLAAHENNGPRAHYANPIYYQGFERVQDRLRTAHAAFSKSPHAENGPTHLLEGIVADSSQAVTPPGGLIGPSPILGYRGVGFGHPGAESYPLRSPSLPASHGFLASFTPMVRHGSLASHESLASRLEVDKHDSTSKYNSISRHIYASTSTRVNSESKQTPIVNNSPAGSHVSGDRHSNSQSSMSSLSHARYSLTLDLSSPRHSAISPLSHPRYSPMTTVSHTQHSPITALRHSPETSLSPIRTSPNTQSPIRTSPATQNPIRTSAIVTQSSTGHSLTANSLSTAPRHRLTNHNIDPQVLLESWSEGKPNPPALESVEEPQNLVRGQSETSLLDSSYAPSRSYLEDPLDVKEEALSVPQVLPSVKEESRSVHQVPPSVKEEDVLKLEDLAEIRTLHECNVAITDNSEPVGERMIKTEELGNVYSCFIQKRARFLVSTPLYKTLALPDRQKLLHTAVAMSTYFTGAHLIDTTNYTWKNNKDAAEKSSHVMSVNSLRPVLSHDQFVFMMRYYMTYSPFFSDQTVTLLMQVLSLFYPESGLTEPRVVEKGRLHYIRLLSRYLISTQGLQAGQEHLKILIESQQEARQLMNILQHVDLAPRGPGNDEVASKKILMEGIQLVFEKARESLTRVPRERQQDGYHTDGSGSEPDRCGPQDELNTLESPPIEDKDRIDFIQRTLIRLADCEDPQILAEARRILPTDLILKFFQL